MNKEIFSFLTILFSLTLNAQYISEVVKLRGHATQLPPGKHHAKVIKLGDRLQADTSLLTGKKSFIQLKNTDGSLVSLGPESKMVIVKLNQEGNGVLNLLKGKIRTKVVPSPTGEKKLFLRTRNATLGVRGTEFETLYHPDNEVTTLLTYKGEVAIKHSENQADLEQEGRHQDADLDEMTEGLNKESVSVKRGQFSQTVATMESTSQPVVISPVQLNMLYKNNEFIEKSEKEITASNTQRLDDISIKAADQEAPPEGINDPAKGIYAPKAGGFIDRETGFYIPPSEDAVFDPNNRVYIAQNVGSIDAQTGQYAPPIGLRLDPKEGFVKKRIKDSAPLEFKEKVAMLEKKLNRGLQKDMVVGDLKKKKGAHWRPFSRRELLNKNSISIEQSLVSLEYNIDADSQIGSGRTFKSTGGKQTALMVHFKATKLYRPYAVVRIRSYDLNNRGTFKQVSRDFTDLGMGIHYSLSSRWNLFFEGALEQTLFLHHETISSATDRSFKRITLPKFALGFEGDILRSKKFSLIGHARLGFNLAKTTGAHEVDAFGYHYGVGLKTQYWLSKNWALTLGGRYFNAQMDSSGTSISYTQSTTQSGFLTGLSLLSFF